MKIVFSVDTIKRGGKERQLTLLASQLLKLKYDIYIISLKYSHDNYLNEYEIDNNRVIFIENKNKISSFFIFKEIIAKIRPDILMSWDSVTAFYSLILYKKYGFKFINGSIQHGIRLFKYSHILRTLILHFSPFRLANSLAGLKANNLNIHNKKNFVLYNGVENKFLNKNTNSLLLKNFIKKENSLIFISIANFVPFKDYTTVFKALSLFKEKEDFYYIILGDGPLRKKIEYEIKKYKLTDNIFLAGKVENVNDYLSISDVMIHSSRGEGISNAILEAMFAGLPVIATNVGGIPETVYRKSSLLFPYKDYKALFYCLLKARELKKNFNPEEIDYKKHLEKFSVNTMVNKFEKIIMEVYKS